MLPADDQVIQPPQPMPVFLPYIAQFNVYMLMAISAGAHIVLSHMVCIQTKGLLYHSTTNATLCFCYYIYVHKSMLCNVHIFTSSVTGLTRASEIFTKQCDGVCIALYIRILCGDRKDTRFYILVMCWRQGQGVSTHTNTIACCIEFNNLGMVIYMSCS